MKILILNGGSSSDKISLYQLGNDLPAHPPAPMWEEKIEWRDHSRGDALEQLISRLSHTIDVVGHRIVHGGPQYEEPVRITPAVKAGIATASAFAPLHNQGELSAIEIVEKLWGQVPQVAVFDTGFHRRMPQAAAVYPGPYEWFTQDIHRYGFHGINHQYCAGRAAQLLKRELNSLKLVTCHLGNGCSMAAIRDGYSIDTTMGFTPLEGLMMGTRSGSVDPGILTYLLRRGDLRPEDIDDVLNRRSGLLGISGLSSDMREILAAVKQGHARAKLAFEIYVHRLQAGIGAMGAVLGGIDALVFTAGVGENSPEGRERACRPPAFLGLKPDQALNTEVFPDADIAAADSKVRVLVIRAREDWAIAQECWRLARVGF